MPLITSVPELADSLGTNIRTVLDYNPQELPFSLPPQLAKGINRANATSSALGYPLNIPTAAQLEDEALGRYQQLLGDARRPLEPAIEKALSVLGDTQGILNKLDWLIG